MIGLRVKINVIAVALSNIELNIYVLESDIKRNSCSDVRISFLAEKNYEL